MGLLHIECWFKLSNGYSLNEFQDPSVPGPMNYFESSSPFTYMTLTHDVFGYATFSFFVFLVYLNYNSAKRIGKLGSSEFREQDSTLLKEVVQRRHCLCLFQ